MLELPLNLCRTYVLPLLLIIWELLFFLLLRKNRLNLSPFILATHLVLFLLNPWVGKCMSLAFTVSVSIRFRHLHRVLNLIYARNIVLCWQDFVYFLWLVIWNDAVAFHCNYVQGIKLLEELHWTGRHESRYLGM